MHFKIWNTPSTVRWNKFMKCPNISEQSFVRKNDNILLNVVCAETLIELMIMGSRIWKTDDSVSGRDGFHFFQISKSWLWRLEANTLSAHSGISVFLPIHSDEKFCCLVFLPSTICWSTFGNAFLASYSADNVFLHSPDHVDIKVVEYLVLGIQAALSPRQSRCDDVNTYVIDEIDYI